MFGFRTKYRIGKQKKQNKHPQTKMSFNDHEDECSSPSAGIEMTANTCTENEDEYYFEDTSAIGNFYNAIHLIEYLL